VCIPNDWLIEAKEMCIHVCIHVCMNSEGVLTRSSELQFKFGGRPAFISDEECAVLSK
jgi:hypothetical protein